MSRYNPQFNRQWNLQRYLQEVSSWLQQRDGFELARLLTYQHQDHSNNERVVHDVNPKQVDQYIKNQFSPWNELVVLHLDCCSCLLRNNFIAAFSHQLAFVGMFREYLISSKEENWMLPVVNVAIRDLRLLAIAADLEAGLSKKTGDGGDAVHYHKDLSKKSSNKIVKPHENMEKAADSLMGIFRACATEVRTQVEYSKKKSLMNVINQLFKIYFKINKLNLCKALIRALDNLKISISFPLAQRVTYNYFLGTKSMFDGEYRKAEELLSFAFTNCHPDSYKNKRLVLIFLIPVKMLLGQMPTKDLLQKYDLIQFESIVASVKQGNLKAFDQALEQNGDFFWKYAIYLILEKLKIIAYRNVFKKVVLISRTHQIPIEYFKIALEMVQDEQLNVDEVHCILANLIYEGKIKGYISLQHQKLVVSKQNPFPNLATVSG